MSNSGSSRRFWQHITHRWRQLENKYRAAGGLAVLFTYETLKTGIAWLTPGRGATVAAFALTAGIGALYHLVAGVDLDDAQEAAADAAESTAETVQDSTDD